MRRALRTLAVPFAIAGAVILPLALAIYLVAGALDLRVEALVGLGLVLLIVAAAGRPEAVRSALTGRTARYGSNTGVFIAACIGILALLGFLSSRHEWRLDLTELGEFTLSPQTVQILSNLNEPVDITAFFMGEDARRQELEDLLKEYAHHTDKIRYELIDPDLKPSAAQQYGVTIYGTIILESGGRRQETFGTDESDLTSAILKVSRGTQKVVYFLTGHGERDVSGYDERGYGQIRDALEVDNYIVSALNLAVSNTVPSDASVLVVAAPRSPLLDQENEAIRDYLGGGGKALIMQDPGEEVDLGEILADWGVGYASDVVIDPERGLFGMDPLSPVVDRFAFSQVTKDLPGVVFSAARSVTRTIAPPENLSIVALVESSAGSWGETDFEALREQVADYDAGADLQGPLGLAVSVEASGTEEGMPSTRLIVLGDADFAANSGLMLGGNGDLFLNSVNWLAEEEELIAIRPKPPVMRTLTLSPGQARFLQYSSVIFLPAAVVIVGAVIWWTRR